jgi:divalent metal cation (Fe/Co/Zn/Cd) transporter
MFFIRKKSYENRLSRFTPPDLTVLEAHAIASEVEKAIKARVEAVYDIMVHVEPAGNRETEGYGLQEDLIG